MKSALLIAVTCACVSLAATARAALINPGDIPGLRLWLDANDASTLTLNGDKVTAWANKGTTGVAGATAVWGRAPPRGSNPGKQPTAR